jgi:hypothetical protein
VSPRRRGRLRFAPPLALAILVLVLVLGTSPAVAAPVTIDFESGATLGQPVTNQYGPPGTPAGPVFKRGEEAGFTQLGCGPPRLVEEGIARSGSRSLKLDGCPGAGGEFWATAAFFSLGYSTPTVEFWLAVPGTLSFNIPVITTAFNAQKEIVEQEETILPPQSSTTFRQVVVTSGAGEIAFVAVEEGTKGTNSNTATGVGLTAQTGYLWLDDLTYDPPSSPPESSFLLGANPSVANLVPGGQTELKVPISWTNNPDPSSSPVLLEASLPSGITGSFSPNPTSTGTSTLTLHAAKSAVTGPDSMTIQGYVDKGLASEKSSSLTLPVDVSPAFEFVKPGTVTVAPCTPRQVQLKLQTPTSFSEPLTLAVNTEGTGAVITAISGGKVTDVTHATTNVTPQNGIATATVALSAEPGSMTVSAHPWTVTASASGYADQTAHGTVAVSAGEVNKVVFSGTSNPASTVYTPALGAPGSRLTAIGAGFCPDAAVAIGDSSDRATPESIAADGTSATFHVPRGAVTGPLTVVPLSGPNFKGPNLTVRSFRNTFGFSWKNNDYKLRLNQEMVDELFGKEETNINVFGWLVRKPEAYLFETMANNYIPGGICFGMAYSSYEFHQGLIAPTHFPHNGGSDVWNLSSADEPSRPLLQYVTERFSLQFTDQLIPAEVNTVLGIHGTDDAINTIEDELSHGYPVMLGLINFGNLFGIGGEPLIEGHTVLAYDTYPVPGGGVAVDVLNSNVPYATSEESDPNAHYAAQFTNSQVVIKEGNWTFPELGWSGSEAGLVVYHHDELPEINGHGPSLPNVFTAALMVAFGSSGDAVKQVSDGHGSLFNGDHLASRSSWPKGVAPLPDFTDHRAPLQLVGLSPKVDKPITATVKRAKKGGAMNLSLPGLQASLQAGSKNGQVDHVSVDPGADSIGYRTDAAASNLGGTLLASPGGGHRARSSGKGGGTADRLVRFQLATGKADDEKLSFPSGRAFELTHSGKASSLKVTLGGFNARGLPVAVKLPAIHVAPGEILKVSPLSWKKLGSTRFRVRSKLHGRLSTRSVRGRVLGSRFATVRRASLVSLPQGGEGIALKLRLRHPPRHGWLSLTGTVLRGGHAVTRSRPMQLSDQALRRRTALLALPKSLPHGRYTLRVRGLEASAQGAMQASRTFSRVFKLRRSGASNAKLTTKRARP